MERTKRYRSVVGDGAIGRSLPVLCLTLSQLLGGCGSDPESDESNQAALYGGGTTATLWNDNVLRNSALVDVCFSVRPWLMTDGSTRCPSQTSTTDCQGVTFPVASIRQTVRAAWEDTWTRAGNIELVNWGDCPIDLATNKHRRASLGNRIAVIFASAVVGNETGIDQVLGRGGKESNEATIVNLNVSGIRMGTDNFNLVHEFGHALGFQHEWRRSDYVVPKNANGDAACAPDETKDQPDTGINFTPTPDLNSKLDKCITTPFDSVLALSPGDIVGVQAAYGRKASGSLVGFRGKCANIQGASGIANTPIIAYPCRNGSNDTWQRTFNTERFQTFISGGFRCMGVNGGSVVSQACLNNSNQQFPLANVEWRGIGSLCAEAASDGTIQMQACDGMSHQKWTFDEGDSTTSLRPDQILSVSTGKCVSTQAGAFGETLMLAPCSTTDTRQRFTFPGNGVISAGQFCMNVLGGSIQPKGEKVGLWNGCTGSVQYNSQFTLSGSIKSGGQCLDILGGVANPGDPIGVFSCNGGANQIWEYYL